MSQPTRTNAILPFVPARDLRGLEGQFAFIDADGKIDHYHYYYGGPAAGVPFGVILCGTDVNEKSSIAVCAGGFAGTLKLSLGAAVAVGDTLEVMNTGRVQPDSGSGTRTLVSIALESGVAGDLIEAVIFNPVELT
ncbi:hypothetical protein SH580_17655 [Coraliomargarita algicola]|uniref:Uncharacterized protein n=1 Tax=Coraliomargarita algicola TaxID=3092156 RepID=A0ABZ0RIN7_9BACT|nr:hypothetical protein [Coraliomargarita sp. J2-16]WPJ95251.1 hypothetical protein SH580_17655 [Coraliomargarita sp. J2-16]